MNTIALAGGWRYGLKYEGDDYTRFACVTSATCNAVLLLAFGAAWKLRPSFTLNLVVHWLLFAWLAWYAFPYLGELP